MEHFGEFKKLSYGQFLAKTTLSVQPISIQISGTLENGLEMNEDFLLKKIKPVLLFGKLIGLVPIQGLFKSSSENLRFRHGSISSICSIILLGMLVAYSGVSMVGIFTRSIANVNEVGGTITKLLFCSIGVFIFAYFYTQADQLVAIIRDWKTLDLQFCRPDTSLSRDANIVATVVLTSAILENFVNHLTLFPVVVSAEGSATSNGSTKPSAWEIYYVRSHKLWVHIIPFNLPAALLAFICNKLIVYAWNYTDVIIIVLARAMYFKFKSLTLEAETTLLAHKNMHDSKLWRQCTEEYYKLCAFLQKLNRFLSPLIFLSYATNTYFICNQLHLAYIETANHNVFRKIYTTWSFLHLMVREYLVNEAGSRIHYWAHSVTEVFNKCPDSAYISQVERTERYVNANTIALTGLGCFAITKPLILQSFGVVFTGVIVLLQATKLPPQAGKT